MESNLTMDINRRGLLVLGAASLALAACSNVIGPPGAGQIYVLRPQLPSHTGGEKVAWALAVALPEAPRNLESDRIVVSRSANTADFFAAANWPDRLTDLVQTSVIDAFKASGTVDVVIPDTESLSTDYILKIQIRDFEAVYTQPDGPPKAVVALDAILVARHSRNLAAQHSIRQEAQASQNSVDAAVGAMDAAFGAALQDLVTWAVSAVPRRRPK
ncbi:MAG: membrane integrity-associated transporter subunit PqiC [Alphaproteobacteria bacterium]|nr:membrane integrity-associated transporter subunit PqiC [Alphaproteobacteria bacterium]